MSPWGHGQKERQEPDYPMPGGALSPDRTAAWFDHVRLGTPFPYGEIGKFRYSAIGEDAWHTAESPYENAPSRPFFFSADGSLTEKAPTPGALSYRYDPDRPRHHDRHDDLFLCPPPEDREDVLSFFSEPFPGDAAFFGPVRFRLTVRTDRPDTAFCLRLYFVEDGKSYNLVDAATTLLHAAPEAKPGQPVSVEILSQPTAFTVKKGCRIRADLSSWTDCFVPHPNTRRPLALARRAFVAHNTLLCGESRVILPEKQ